jgi:hypothetical protein
MAALTAGRPTQRRSGLHWSWTVKSGAVAYQGGMAALDGGELVRASANASLIVVGVFAEPPVPGQRCLVERGCWQFANSTAADAITAADIGQPCYAADDQTVARTSATNTRPKAGIIRDVDAFGVWVEF